MIDVVTKTVVIFKRLIVNFRINARNQYSSDIDDA